MSRAGNLVGRFVVEGSGPLPWTPQDEDRLRGRFLIGDRQTRPHVDTPSGPYVIGKVPLPTLNARVCEDCGAARVRRIKDGAEAYVCGGCGAEYGLQYLLARNRRPSVDEKGCNFYGRAYHGAVALESAKEPS